MIDFESKKLIEEALPGYTIEKNNTDYYTVYKDYYRIIMISKRRFVTPMLSKLTNFLELDGDRIASFEIALPYCSKTIAPTNYLYGVMDDCGNVIGPVVNFKTKESYTLVPYNTPEKITSEGIKIHNFDSLIKELSKLEEDLHYELEQERSEYLKLHEQSIYKKN